MKHKCGFTLIECLCSLVVASLLIGALGAAWTVMQQGYEIDAAARTLQTDAVGIARKIIDGAHGLRDARSFAIDGSDPSHITFTGSDGTIRQIQIAQGQGVNGLYCIEPGETDILLYKWSAAGPQLALQFSLLTDQVSGITLNDTVRVIITITQTINGRNISGSVQTDVCLRNFGL